MPGNIILMPTLGRDCVFEVIALLSAGSGYNQGTEISKNQISQAKAVVTSRTRVQLLGSDEEWVGSSAAEEGGNSIVASDDATTRIAAAATAAAEAVGGTCPTHLSHRHMILFT